MADRPILFSAPMVRAILSGQKTQTRRAVNPQPIRNEAGVLMWARGKHSGFGVEGVDVPLTQILSCPYGQPGDRLWVREAWKAHTTFDHLPPREIPQSHVWYLADDGYKAESRTRASMHMPRWASRITLEITGVRVERLQGISEADARAEGIELDPGEGGVFHVPGLAGCCSDTAAGSFRRLWESINGAESCAANPFVWVVEFKRKD